jgi:diguanylate cyclase (GGDEF)-like protein
MQAGTLHTMNTRLNAWIEPLGHMLDGLGVAMCLFDAQDHTVAWNDMFLRYFPEHEGHVFAGEHYRHNLRRFYLSRLEADEIAHIDEYIEAGIARHRHQAQPYVFAHRGRQLLVSSLPLNGVGRLRLWRLHQDVLHDQASTTPPPGSGSPLSLLDRVPNGLTLCDAAGRITWVNAAFAHMYRLRGPQAAVGATLAEVFHAAWLRVDTPDTAACTQGLQTLRDMLRFTGAPFELTLPGPRHCRVVARPGGAGECLYAHLDITELKHQQALLARAEAAARESAALLERESAILQTTLQSLDQGVAMVNAEGRVEFCNQRVFTLLDLPPEVLQNRPHVEDVIRYQREHGEFDGLPPEAIAHFQPADGAPIPPLVVRRRPNGRVLEIRSLPVQGGGMLRTFTDVTERHAHQQHIEYLASHDGLTGLLNRCKFMECMAAEASLARRMQSRFAVLYLDLDGFKPINDTHGHAAGDQVLVHVARTLRHVARASDFVARLGGDEFAVLLRGIDRQEQARALAQRLSGVLAQPWQIQAQEQALQVCIGASIGLAMYPEHGEDPEALLASADRAMYLSKTGQRTGSLARPLPTRGTP